MADTFTPDAAQQAEGTARRIDCCTACGALIAADLWHLHPPLCPASDPDDAGTYTMADLIGWLQQNEQDHEALFEEAKTLIGVEGRTLTMSEAVVAAIVNRAQRGWPAR